MTSVIITIVIALILSAFCSGMEIAFLSSNKLRIEVEKDSGITDRILQLFVDNPQQYITTLLVGNNIVLVIFSMKMNELLTPIFERWMSNGAMISFIVTIIATLVVLLLGEYLPKNVFRSNPNTLLRAFSPIVFLFYIILYPVAIFCTWCSHALLRLIGVKRPKDEADMTFTRSDLDFLVEEVIASEGESGDEDEEEELPSENEMQILRNALDFSSVRIRDCFVPRTEIVALPYDSNVQMLKQVFQSSGFSKILIYKEDIDNIVGYIHCSEMFLHSTDWQQRIKNISFVPENYPADKLMRTFMQERKSIAVVVDEYGGTAGIVTLEDIIEEIFGEIEDEHDKHRDASRRLNEKDVLLSGRISVEEANERFDLNLPESDEYDTIAGLILHTTGTFPQKEDIINLDNYRIKCLKIKDNRIEIVKITE